MPPKGHAPFCVPHATQIVHACRGMVLCRLGIPIVHACRGMVLCLMGMLCAGGHHLHGCFVHFLCDIIYL